MYIHNALKEGTVTVDRKMCLNYINFAGNVYMEMRGTLEHMKDYPFV